MANTKSLHKFNITRLIAVLSQYIELGSMFVDHFPSLIKTHLQLLFVDHDHILRKDMIIHISRKRAIEGRVRGRASTWRRSRKKGTPSHFYRKVANKKYLETREQKSKRSGPSQASVESKSREEEFLYNGEDEKALNMAWEIKQSPFMGRSRQNDTTRERPISISYVPQIKKTNHHLLIWRIKDPWGTSDII